MTDDSSDRLSSLATRACAAFLMRAGFVQITHISPNMFSVKMTPFNFLGLATIIIAAESTSWCSSLIWGYSLPRSSVTVLRQRREEARTLALSTDVMGKGGLEASATWAATRVMRSTSGTE